jgi:hypothetical protein
MTMATKLVARVRGSKGLPCLVGSGNLVRVAVGSVRFVPRNAVLYAAAEEGEVSDLWGAVAQRVRRANSRCCADATVVELRSDSLWFRNFTFSRFAALHRTLNRASRRGMRQPLFRTDKCSANVNVSDAKGDPHLIARAVR